MSERWPEQREQVMPRGGNANTGRRDISMVPMGLSVVTIDAGRQMAEMERMFRAAGNHALQMEALATLRRWQFDSRLDSASRRRASVLVWRFQPNGWDEV